MSADLTALSNCEATLSTWQKMSPGVYSAIVTILIVLVSGACQGIDSDTGYQVRALQQNREGVSPTFNTFISPKPADLSQDVASWMVWWAPGNGILLSLIMHLGLNLGTAARILAILCLVVGAGGWSLWIASFALNNWIRLLVSAGLPWSVYVHNAVFYYGAETLLFAATPWALLVTVKWMKYLNRGQCPVILAVLSGGSLGILYALKYTGGFVTLGALGFVLFQAAGAMIRRRVSLQSLWPIAFFTVLALTPAIFINVINSAHTHTMNLVTARLAFQWQWETLLFGMVNPVLAFARADAALGQLFNLLHLPLGSIEIFSGTVALLGAVGLWFLICSNFPSRLNAQLSYFVLLTSVASLAAIWTISSSASYESRHVAMASIAILPYLAEQAIALRSGRMKVILALCGFVYVLVPSAYGAVAVVGKTIRHARYQVGPSGLYNGYLSNRDVARTRSRLLLDFSPASDVWYVVNPVAAADLPGRVLIRRTNDITVDDLRKEKFYSSKPVRIRLLLPDDDERRGTGAIIRDSFPRAVGWHEYSAEPTLHVWVSWLGPSPKEELEAPRPVLPWAQRQ